MRRRNFLAGAVIGTAVPGALPRRSDEPLDAPLAQGQFRTPDGRLTVPVHVNGQGPFRLVVDTAANATVLSATVVERLGLQPVDRIMMHGLAGPEEVRRVEVADLTTGVLHKRGLRVIVGTPEGLSADGLLGSDVLAEHRAVFRFGRDPSVAIERSRAERTGLFTGRRKLRARVLGERRLDALMTFEAHALRTPFIAILDSGAATTIVNPALARAAGRIDDATQAVAAPLRSPTGQPVAVGRAVLPDLRFGGVRLVDLPVFVADLHVFGLLGLSERPAMLLAIDALSRLERVVIDVARREVILDR